MSSDFGKALNVEEREGSRRFIFDCLFVLIAFIKSILSLSRVVGGIRIRTAPPLPLVVEFVSPEKNGISDLFLKFVV